MVKPGQIYKPTDSRRDNRRIRVLRLDDPKSWDHVLVESRLVGQRTWKPAPSIRLDRLESRHYKLVRS